MRTTTWYAPSLSPFPTQPSTPLTHPPQKPFIDLTISPSTPIKHSPPAPAPPVPRTQNQKQKQKLARELKALGVKPALLRELKALGIKPMVRPDYTKELDEPSMDAPSFSLLSVRFVVCLPCCLGFGRWGVGGERTRRRRKRSQLLFPPLVVPEGKRSERGYLLPFSVCRCRWLEIT